MNVRGLYRAYLVGGRYPVISGAILLALFLLHGTVVRACTLEEIANFKAAIDVANMEVMSVQDPAQREVYVTQAIRDELDNMSAQCREELLRPVVKDERCEQINRNAFDQNALQIEVANTLYLTEGDRDQYFDLVADIHRCILSNTPQRCWFQGVAAPTVVKPQSVPHQSCSQAWNQYNACKRQVETALKRCTVTPGHCTNLGPTCIAPSC